MVVDDNGRLGDPLIVSSVGLRVVSDALVGVGVLTPSIHINSVSPLVLLDLVDNVVVFSCSLVVVENAHR